MSLLFTRKTKCREKSRKNFWRPFRIYKTRYKSKGLGPASRDVTDIVDTPWEDSPSLRSGWRLRWETVRRAGEMERKGTGIGM